MAVLGELELATMNVLWSVSEPVSVRTVHEEISKTRDLAYTTVMTVLDRLAKKHLALRKLEGRAWIYKPAQSKASLVADEIESILESAEDERANSLVELVSRLNQDDRETLLEALDSFRKP